MNIKKRFKSCFISEVIFHDNGIILQDCGHNTFNILNTDTSVVSQFKKWFNTIYMACIPQILTVIEYDIIDKNDVEVMQIVKNMYFKVPNNSSELKMLNETNVNEVI